MKTNAKLVSLVLFSGIILAAPVRANDQPTVIVPPQRALAINDPALTNYGLRLRVNGSLINMAEVAARNLLGTFSEPQSTFNSTFKSTPGGFNAILDPGYDAGKASAGGLRTSPLQMMWSWRNDACTGDDAACLSLGKDTPKRFHWLQTRSPDPKCARDERVMVDQAACNAPTAAPRNFNARWIYGPANGWGPNPGENWGVLCNQRGVPTYWHSNFREHGFYVSKDGSCFEEQNVCMNNAGYLPRGTGDQPGGFCFEDTCTSHLYLEKGEQCAMETQFINVNASFDMEVYLNVGVFIFPNGLVENAGAGAAWGVPVWARPVVLNYNAPGDYFGYVPTKRYGTYTGRDASLHPLRLSGPDGTFRWVASGFPSSKAAYNETNAYDELFGSYFRQGDDIAFYADVRQMQIHSIDRDTVSRAANNNHPDAVAGCGMGPVYTGQVSDGKPVYFWARVPQCLRPKSYWHGPPNVAAGQAQYKWVACNAYDTYLSDGVTPNPNSDDGYPIYPGNTGEKCGAQLAGQPNNPNGAGWSALRLQTFNVDTANDKIDFELRGEDWRMELAMYWAFATECIVVVSGTSPSCGGRPGFQLKRKWNTGVVMLQNVLLKGNARIFALDEHSCSAANGDCSAPWGGANDKQLRPDRMHIGVNLTDVSLAMYPDPPKPSSWGNGNAYGTTRNSYRPIYGDLENYGETCFATVYDECAFAFARWPNPTADGGFLGDQVKPELILGQIVDALGSEFNAQFRALIEDTVGGLNEGLPNLSSVLGDPWVFGNSLVDVGIFLTGHQADGYPDPLKASRRIWPVRFQAGPAGKPPVVDVNASLGFRPIAFESPIPNNGILKIDDPSDGIASTSFFAVPKIMYPDTTSCQLIIKGPGAQSANGPGGNANTWIKSNTGFSYDNANGWISGIGVGPSGHDLGGAFINRANWRWGLVRDLHKSPTGSGYPAFSPSPAYRIEAGRGPGGDGAFSTSTNWGISRGWIRLSAPTSGSFADLRPGDLFSFDNNPNAKYRIIEVSAPSGLSIRVDFASATQHKNVPFNLTGSQPYTITARSCSRDASQYPNEVTGRDYGDYVIDRNWTDPKTGKSYSGRDVIDPYFVADASMKKAPNWCMTPGQVKSEMDQLASRFPMKTWLSFDATDTPPAGFDASQSMADPAKFTLGQWNVISKTPIPSQEQISMSDVAIAAASTAMNGWVSTTQQVSNANGGRALRSGTIPADSLTAAFSTASPSTPFSVWVAQSRVNTNPVFVPATEQITVSDSVLNSSASVLGGWTSQTGTVVSGSNASRAQVSAGPGTSTMTVPINTQSPSSVYNVWLAHSRVYVPGAVKEQIVVTDSEITPNGSWTSVSPSNANAGSALSGGNGNVLTVSFSTQAASSTFRLWVAYSRLAGASCGGIFQQGCVNSSMTVHVNGTAIGTAISNTADNSWSWYNPGTLNLAAGNHTITFTCTVSNTSRRCGLDGFILTTETIAPSTDPRLTPYASADWTDPALDYYDSGVRANVATSLSVEVDGTQIGSTLSQTANNSWQWVNLGTVSLANGAHNVRFACTVQEDTNNRCAIDGLVLTTQGTNPASAAGFTPYATANWDANTLDFYTPPSNIPTATQLTVRINGVQLGATLAQATDNDWGWVKFGEVTLAPGNHTIQFACQAGGDYRCGVDGLVITTGPVVPQVAAAYVPYASANWDDPTLDYSKPASASGNRGVVRANQNDYNVKENDDIEYHASIHIHQRSLNQLAQAIVGSGSLCVEFAQTDPETGEKTLWADFLTTDRFAAFIPELRGLFGLKSLPVKMRIAPQAMPRVRTGMGNLNGVVSGTMTGSAQIVNEPYTVAAALPDLQLSVAVELEPGVEVTVMRMNWNTVVGLYLRAMRQCHELDPERMSPQCTSLDPNIRTISGYWQLYLDYGDAGLGASFEPPYNYVDGFQSGRFTRNEMACTDPAKCAALVNPGQAKFQLLSADCGMNCNTLGIANSIVTMLDSTVSLYASTRASTSFLSLPFNLDFLYIGPDGPNDDGIGTAHDGSRGDHLGIYVRMFGESLDLMGIVGGLAAPPALALIPKATIDVLDDSPYITTNSPRFNLKTITPVQEGQAVAYSYRLNGGFWRTPRTEPMIQLDSLTEGSHRLEVRAMVETANGWVNQLEPTLLQFKVDSLAPELSIPITKQGVYKDAALVDVHDWQTPVEDLVLEYSMDGGEWKTLDEPKVPLRRYGDGRHTLRVRATDQAGNTSSAAREITVANSPGCGCAAASTGEVGGMLVVFGVAYGLHALLRRRRLS